MGIKYLRDPLSALGSKLNGGRYNFIGKFEVLYVAPDAQAAVQETIKNIHFRFPPKALVTIEVDLQNIIDLRDANMIEVLEIDVDRLFSPWRKIQDIDQIEAYTQTLGRLIYEFGVQDKNFDLRNLYLRMGPQELSGEDVHTEPL